MRITSTSSVSRIRFSATSEQQSRLAQIDTPRREKQKAGTLKRANLETLAHWLSGQVQRPEHITQKMVEDRITQKLGILNWPVLTFHQHSRMALHDVKWAIDKAYPEGTPVPEKLFNAFERVKRVFHV